MVGARGLSDLGHESVNRKHKDIEKLTASSPRAKTGVEGWPECGRNGERRTTERCKVRRGQAQRRKHEKEKQKAWGLCKDDAKLGKELTRAKMR